MVAASVDAVAGLQKSQASPGPGDKPQPPTAAQDPVSQAAGRGQHSERVQILAVGVRLRRTKISYNSGAKTNHPPSPDTSQGAQRAAPCGQSRETQTKTTGGPAALTGPPEGPESKPDKGQWPQGWGAPGGCVLGLLVGPTNGQLLENQNVGLPYGPASSPLHRPPRLFFFF